MTNGMCSLAGGITLGSNFIDTREFGTTDAIDPEPTFTGFVLRCETDCPRRCARVWPFGRRLTLMRWREFTAILADVASSPIKDPGGGVHG